MSRSPVQDALAPSGRADPRFDEVNLAQIARALRRRWGLILGLTLLAMLAMTAFVQLVAPRYTAEAKILLESRDTFYTRPSQDRADPIPQIDEQAVASQVQVVTSRDLAREAVRRLGLVGNEEFDPLAKGIGPIREVLVTLGLAKDPVGRDPEERVIDTYLDHLLVYSAGKSRIVTIEFRSRDPELAARAANTAAEVYLEAQETAKSDTARSASTWLGSNIAALRTKVADAERKVEEYRTRSGLFVGGSNNNGPIGSQQLTELSTQLSQARSAQADSQAKARLIKEMIQSGRTFEIPDVANNELVRRLIEQRIGLRAQLALELRTLLPQHPRIKELNAQLDDLESQIRGAAERTVRTLENDARIAGARVETLQAAVDAQKKIVSQANESEVQLRALEREARIQRDQLESYMSRYREAAARDEGSAAPADARIVSRAVVPDLPSFPKKVPMIAFAAVAAFAFSSGAIVARELMGSSGAYAERPVRRTGRRRSRPANGPVPTGRALVPYAGPFSPALGEVPEADWTSPGERYDFEALVSRLKSRAPEGRGSRILVTAYGPPPDAAEDLALALGRLLAQDARTLLITVDAPQGEHENRVGFSDFMAGEVAFAEIIGREPGSRLHRIFPGISEKGRKPDWEAAEFALAAVDQTYEWVICLLRDPESEDRAMLILFGSRVDAIVIASEADPADAGLVSIYEAACDSGAADVIVAREEALAGEVGAGTA